MGKMKYLLFSGLVTLITLLASTAFASTCAASSYQPQLPKSLQKN